MFCAFNRSSGYSSCITNYEIDNAIASLVAVADLIAVAVADLIAVAVAVAVAVADLIAVALAVAVAVAKAWVR